MKNIVYVITTTGLGGAETQLLEITKKLNEYYNIALVISIMPIGDLGDSFFDEKIKLVSLNVTGLISLVLGLIKMYKLIYRLKPDILHSHLIHSNIISRVVGKLAGIKYIISSAHNIDEIHGRKLLGELYKVTEPLAHLTTNVSQAAINKYLELGLIKHKRYGLVYNGIDIEKYNNKAFKNDTFSFICVASFKRQKNHFMLFDAINEVRNNTDIKFKVDLVGTGGLEDELITYAKTIGINDYIHFLGKCNNVPEILFKNNAFVLSSDYEGFGIVLCEAMASGLPIITTDNGPAKEIVDSTSGFIVPIKNSKAFAQKMLHVLNMSDKERIVMGKAGRKKIQDCFSIKSTVHKWRDIYEAQ